MAAIAEAILMQISAKQVQSLHRVAPLYLKLVTRSSWPFMLIFALVLFVSFLQKLYLVENKSHISE